MSREKELLDLANSVTQHAKLLSVTQSLGEFKLLPGDIGAIKTLEQNVNVSTRINSRPKVRGEICLRLLGVKEDKTKVGSVHAHFTCEYEILNEKPSEAAIEAYVRVSTTFNSWAFWREFVQSSSCRAGIQPIHVPLLSPNRAAELAVKSGQGRKSPRSQAADRKS